MTEKRDHGRAFAAAAGLLLAGATVPAWGGSTERGGGSLGGKEGKNASFSPAISADGRFVAFVSYATNLVPGDTNDVLDVFVHDRRTGRTERVSVSSRGEQGDSDSFRSEISGDGRFVAFASDATNLVASDTSGVRDIFVHDRRTGRTERVSVSSRGEQANGDSDDPTISVDGRFVAFFSSATNLVPGDTNGFNDVFLRDRVKRTTTRVSVSSRGKQANDH